MSLTLVLSLFLAPLITNAQEASPLIQQARAVRSAIEDRFGSEPRLSQALSEAWLAGKLSSRHPVLMIVRRSRAASASDIVSAYARATGMVDRTFRISTYQTPSPRARSSEARVSPVLNLREAVLTAAAELSTRAMIGIELMALSGKETAAELIREVDDWIAEGQIRSGNRLVDLRRTPIILFFDGGEAVEGTDAEAFDRRAFHETFVPSEMPNAIVSRVSRLILTTGACQSALIGSAEDSLRP